MNDGMMIIFAVLEAIQTGILISILILLLRKPSEIDSEAEKGDVAAVFPRPKPRPHKSTRFTDNSKKWLLRREGKEVN